MIPESLPNTGSKPRNMPKDQLNMTGGRAYAKSRFIKGNPVKEFDTTKKLDRAFNGLMR